MSNPWTADTPENTLITLLSAQGCYGNVTETDIADNTSLQIIQALNEISSVSHQIHKAELEVMHRNLHRDNVELVSRTGLDKVQSSADEIAQNLSMILENREALLERFKVPHESGRLVVEARYQKYAVSTFEKLGKVLGQLTVYISSVAQYKNSRLSAEGLERSSAQILELSNSLKSVYDNFQAEHKTLMSIRQSETTHCTLEF